jgi:hypothetical protein
MVLAVFALIDELLDLIPDQAWTSLTLPCTFSQAAEAGFDGWDCCTT